MQEDESITSLAERTAETNEDIDERSALVEALSEMDSEAVVEEEMPEVDE